MKYYCVTTYTCYCGEHFYHYVAIPEGESIETDHLIGENYCLRALCHLNLVTLYATPYTRGADKPGIVVRTSTDCSVTERSTVGFAFEQIVKDLEKAASLMEKGTRRGNAGFVSYNTARGLLTRVHLYMGNWTEVVNTVDALLNGANPASKLDADLTKYFINAKTSQETLFCIAHELTETPGQSGIASMFINDGMGWGEIYPSNPLLYLYERYPEDVRYTGFIHPQYPDPLLNKTSVYFPDPETADDSSGRLCLTFQVTPDGDNYTFTDGCLLYTYPSPRD